MSKRGRAMIRKHLFCAAINMVRSSVIMHQGYHQMVERGMPQMKVLIAIGLKLLRLVFALVRDNALYEENYGKIHYKLAP